MFRKLFRQRTPLDAAPQAAVPAGQRVYAIGDIHGRLDLLDRLLDQIAGDDQARGDAQTQLIFLGDYVDRGPDSAGVIDRLIELRTAVPESRFLAGNHEEVFQMVLDGDVEALRFFARIGGRQTILSYGISRDQYEHADYDELMRLVQERVPEAHRTFLAETEDLIELGDYCFVHAGVDPAAPLAEQRLSDLRWIREGFLDHDEKLERVIVHGHSITPDVEARPHRIGIDTGAYRSGKLTALGLEGSERWLLQTGREQPSGG